MAAIPDFLIIGAQKAGTTAAARNLALHPQIRIFSGTTEYGQKEMEFFNQHWERGIPWYASHFDRVQALNGEKTAELLHRKVCHERMHITNPGFQLIVLLRSPVERAYSQWKMAAFNKKDETRTFDAIVRHECESIQDPTTNAKFYDCCLSQISCWREGYLLKGMYADQLESLLTWFPRSQVFIGITERIRAAPMVGYSKIFEFLGIPAVRKQFGEHFISPPTPPMLPETCALLSSLYKKPNERLFSLLGEEIPEWKGGL